MYLILEKNLFKIIHADSFFCWDPVPSSRENPSQTGLSTGRWLPNIAVYVVVALNCTVMGQEAHYINVGILPHKTDEVFLHEIFP